MSAKDAPGTPCAAPPDSEGAWLPESPSGGILARLRGFSAADDEWWHEKRCNVGREYLGTLMNWKEGCPKATVVVSAPNLPKPLHQDMLTVIRKCWPWANYSDLQTRALDALTGEYGRGEVEVGEEWHDCLALGSDYAKIDAVAEAVHFCRRRDERAKIIKHMLGVAHDPDAVATDCQRLGGVA